jgi:hypothetical protein
MGITEPPETDERLKIEARRLFELRIDRVRRAADDLRCGFIALAQINYVTGANIEIDVHLRIGRGFYAGNAERILGGIERHFLRRAVD